MQLNLIEAPASEIITLEETKKYLRIDHDFDDNLIVMLIKSTREAIEAVIQKSIMKQAWEYNIQNQHVSNFYFNEGGDYPNVFDDVLKISLPKPPVRKIISVEIGDKEIDPEKCSLDTVNNRFCLCIHDKRLLARKRKISVSIKYEAGISDRAENIPYQLKLANLMLVANAFQERYSYSQNNVVSQGVKQLLSPFLEWRLF